MIASARRADLRGPTDRRLRQPEWQARAWAYYQLVGEAHDAAQFYGKHLSKLDVFPEYLNDKGEWIKVTVDGTGDEEVPHATDLLGIWDRVQDPNGGRSAMFRNYGQHRFIAGESYLLVTESQVADGEPTEKWEIVSTDELRKNGDKWRRVKAPGMIEESLSDLPDDALEPLPGTAVVYRMWRPHPRFSELPDAPMSGVLDVCEELVILTRAVRARARSRIAGAGLFLYPNDVDFESEDDPDGQAQEDGDESTPFERNLRKAMMMAVEDEGDASALVPVMAGVPPDSVEKFKLIDFGQAAKEYPEIQLRDEAVTRFARGVDMPVEIVLGLGSANHWTSWMIDRQTWKAHVQPVAEEMVSDFSGVYYRPAVKAAALSGVDEARVRLNYDASKIVNNPDQSKDAQATHDRFALSDASLRVAGGWDESDAPSEDELAARVERLATAKGRGAAVTGLGGTSDVSQQNVEVDTAPATQPDGSQASAALEGAMALAVTRCHEMAGSRIRTRLQRRPNAEYEARIDRVPNRTVSMTLGQQDVMKLQLAGKQLVAGGSECLAGWMQDAGYPQEWIDQCCRDVEEEALRTLWRPKVQAV